MAHGIPTSYKELRDYLIRQYPDIVQFRDKTISAEEYGDLAVDEFAAEMLLYAMDHAAGEKWSDFEEALGRVNFYYKLPGPTEKESDERSPLHNQRMGEYLLRVDRLTNAIIHSSRQYWPVFFSRWIKEVETIVESGQVLPKQSLAPIFNKPDMLFLTFNYTKTLEVVYGIKGVNHIHNRVGQKALIFGHGVGRPSYDEPYEDRAPISSSFLEDFMLSLKKDTDRQLKRFQHFFKKLDSRIDAVYSYGFSFSKVDSPYIKEIVKRISPNAVWYFTEHEAHNKEALRRKKIKLRRYGFKGTFGVYEG